MNGFFPIYVVSVCATIFALTSCQIADPNASGEKARIRFGESIDGVEIGMDSSAVIDRMGRPHYIGLGDFQGVIFVYAFANPDSAGYCDSLTVGIFTNPNDPKYGVNGITVRERYSGRTADGVGIGSSRDVARSAWGEPTRSDVEDSSTRRKEVYELGRTYFVVTYTDDKIQAITLRGRW